MSWREKYADKIVSPQEAISVIKSGDSIFSTMHASLPYALLEELGAQKDRLSNVNLYMGFGGNIYRPLAKACNGHVNVQSLFWGPLERSFKYRMGSNIGMQIVQLSKSYDDRASFHLGDVVMMAASPPNENGVMSFGTTPIDTALCLRAKTVLLQVNENIPFIIGKDNMLNINDATYIVDKTEPLCVMEPSVPSPEDFKIANLIAERITDGACIQFGIGGLSAAMGEVCRDKKHLGIHTELFVESMMDLIECGAVDNSMKKLDKGISTFGFALGGEKLYKFLDNNPSCQSRCFSYSNDPYLIMQNENVISVNSAMQVDLTGQVASEGIGYKQHSGIGGQLDYVRGSQMSPGGHSFIALESTRCDKSGKRHSKIVLSHPEGTPITTPRSEVEFIVTEYGIANLKYETIENRAKRLIAIAHPDFREELLADAKRVGYII
ncbi:MAG: hypothetical protein GX684_06465 [Ruminococcaceae bacterium]|nr:hypothetical protein [Oscillospiraceae bacterium]